MIREAGKTRIFEEIHVIDEDGTEVRTFTREVDPRFYMLINISEEADYVTHVLRAPLSAFPP